jgi:tRNA(adenine34) deaminase
MTDDERYMSEAVAQALKGAADGEVPIGSVAVKGGIVIARGHNRRMAQSDITAHAEMSCLRDLSANYQKENGELSFDLSDITIYSTLEPCAMCLGAMIHYKIGRIVFGEYDLLLGACGSHFHFHNEAGMDVCGGVLRHETRKPLLDFFERQLGHPSTRWKDIELLSE